MMNLRHFLIYFLASLNTACTINSVDLLPAGGVASGNRAVIVYGVKVDGAWPYPGYVVQVAEYDLDKQNITGNCFRFNRAEARVSPPSGPVKYFAFDVPAGHYIYSPFNGPRFAGDPTAFEAPAGQSVYLGNFILEPSKWVYQNMYPGDVNRDLIQSVSLTRHLEAVRNDINTALPGLQGQISLARAIPVKRPFPFLCTP